MSMLKLSDIISHIRLIILTAILPVAGSAWAWDASVYAEKSALAEGRWVKIKVTESGIHLISLSTLRQWGFTDPEKVRVYGYGGAPISDVLTASSYIDDLPMTASELTSRGLVFYAQGPESWAKLNNGRFSRTPNYYSQEAFYFLSDTGAENSIPATGESRQADSPSTTFTETILHEQELLSAGGTGHEFLGEDFLHTRSQNFNFTLPGRADSKLWIDCNFAIKTKENNSTVTLSINGTDLPLNSSNKLTHTGDDSALHYRLFTISSQAEAEGENLRLGIKFATSANILRLARLDNIYVSYNRRLNLDGAQLTFRTEAKSMQLSGASSSTRIWDVTSPAAVKKVNAAVESDKASWSATERGLRTYVAWNPEGSLPSPSLAGEVANQNLHGADVPDMVIFTLPQWRSYAQQIAALHSESEGMEVLVAVHEDVYNEFSSGTPDYNAFRRMLKMLWDRGGGSDNSDSKLRCVMMFGRALSDHRAITPAAKDVKANILPQWQSISGASDNTSYTTEDFLAFLRDGSGRTPGYDYHCIGVGRIPVNSATEARATVDKIRTYMADNDKDDWKNRIVLATDDGDNRDHIDQMEKAHNLMIATPGGSQSIYHKIHVDAFPLIDNVAKEAHDRMMRLLNQGAMWWWYIGHATTVSWTGEGLLTMHDVNNVNFKHMPMLYAATCSFLKWDDISSSGAETMFFNPKGIIGAIAATRPVYISMNENMSLDMAQAVTLREADGRSLALGEILRRSKNMRPKAGDTNKLRYALLGDPALRLATPIQPTAIESIAGQPLDPETPPVIKAHQSLTIEGAVLTPEGDVDTAFNGIAGHTIYDAEHSTVTLNHRNEAKDSIIEEMGERLFIGRGEVKDGRFSLKVDMPTEIASNYRPATLNIYAYDTSTGRDAVAVTRGFYVYGFDDSDNSDTTPPVIELFALNSESFTSGSAVNETPMVIARVRDDVGINISSAGIGHQISLQLDGSKSYPDVVQYYTPGTDGSKSGSVYYQMPTLPEGRHTLRLRVWDTANNMSEETIEFKVVKGQAPTITELFADANPAIDHANFYVRHNRPDAVIQVDLNVYDLLGRTVWSASRSGRSDMFLSSPIEWDLTNNAGHRVQRGIYIYRATITSDGTSHTSASRKIAVTAP